MPVIDGSGIPLCATWRVIPRQCLPLNNLSRARRNSVQDLSDAHRLETSAGLGRTGQWGYQRPLGIRQIAFVSKAATVCSHSMFRLLHEARL